MPSENQIVDRSERDTSAYRTLKELQIRILILGADVIGSFNAARLKDAGQDVTLLARGRRRADLGEHDVVLEGFMTGQRTTRQVLVVDRLESLRFSHRHCAGNQTSSILPAWEQNRRIPSVLFLDNNAPARRTSSRRWADSAC